MKKECVRQKQTEEEQFADPTQFHKFLLCQFACWAGYEKTDKLVMHLMIISSGSCKSFGLLNSSLSQDQGQNYFFCFIAFYPSLSTQELVRSNTTYHPGN